MYLRALNNNAVAKVESVKVHMTGLEQNKTYSFEVEDGQERREREGGEGCIGARGYPEHRPGEYRCLWRHVRSGALPTTAPGV
jgi:hypothetical protein